MGQRFSFSGVAALLSFGGKKKHGKKGNKIAVTASTGE